MTWKTKHPVIKGTPKKKKKHFTIHVISDPTQSGKSIKIPTWIKYPVILLVAILAITFIDVYGYVKDIEAYLGQTNQSYEAKTEEAKNKDSEIEKLKKENEAKEQQLKKLQSEVENVKEMVEKVQSYQEQLDSKLNSSIDGEAPKETSENKDDSSAVSNTQDNKSAAISHKEQNLGTSFTQTRSFRTAALSMSTDLDSLQDKIAQELSQYGEMEAQLDEMIPYWEAYPNAYPVDYPEINCSFGWRSNPFGRRGYEFHSGVDFEAQNGTPIYATGKGVVIQSEYEGSYGYIITIDHGYGFQTKYAHNSKNLVQVGDEVMRGDLIAKAGATGRATGTHVHYEILVNGESVDPLPYIQ